jgi:DNA-binding ferritin-like protein (Dps family)
MIDRKVYKLPLRKSGISNFPCPTCGKGRLRVVTDKFHYEETKSSKLAYSHEAWDPDWITYIYSCLLECSDAGCNDIVSSTGKGSVSEDYGCDHEGTPEIAYEEHFTPEYFTPHLKMFPLSKETSEEVIEEINKSFSLFFADPDSAANHIRISIEHLLTHLKIKRYITNNGKRNYLALHKRIELLPKKYDHIRDLFFAIKWLGNAGSHSTKSTTLDDVLDSYELMEELLAEIFINKSKKVASLANKINKKKGPK